MIFRPTTVFQFRCKEKLANLGTAVPNSFTMFNTAVYVHISVTNSTLNLTLTLTLALALTLTLTLTLIEFGTAVPGYADLLCC